MKRPITLFFLSSFALFLTFCKKEKEPEPTSSPSKEELLAGTTFKAYIITSNTLGSVDVFSSKPICEKDNILQYYRDGRFFVLEGTTKCNSTDPDTITGPDATWSFNTAKDSIIYYYQGSEIDREKIKSISSTILQTEYDGGTYPGESTLQAQ